MRRLSLTILAILCLAVLAACGGGATPAPSTPAQPEGTGCLVEIELEAVGAPVEGGRQPSQQPRRRRPEDPKPEMLDVG